MEDKVASFDVQNKKLQEIEVRFKIQTIQKRKVKTWTPQQDQLLFQLYQRYPKKWNKISELMINRNQNQCLHRYRRLVQVGEHKKIWSPEEDQTVLKMVHKYGNNWKFIAAELKNKTGKQIRERFINKLNPSIKKEEWSQAEDFRIIELYTKYGSKWSQISKGLPGRPQNRIKNRFYSYIQKNYDIVVKEESSSPTNYMAHQNSSEIKDEGIFQRLVNPNLIYVPSKKISHQLSDSDLLENKECKDSLYSFKMEKDCSDKGFQQQVKKEQKEYEEQIYRERSLKQINEPNEIAYRQQNQAHEDLLYFEEE